MALLVGEHPEGAVQDDWGSQEPDQARQEGNTKNRLQKCFFVLSFSRRFFSPFLVTASFFFNKLLLLFFISIYIYSRIYLASLFPRVYLYPPTLYLSVCMILMIMLLQGHITVRNRYMFLDVQGNNRDPVSGEMASLSIDINRWE